MKSRNLLAVALVLSTPGLAQAAVYCVTNGTQLNDALIASAFNGQADVIRLATGSYLYPGAGGGTFIFTPGSSDGFDIEISGGWTSVGANPCGQLPNTSRAIDTVITTNTAQRLMVITPQIGNMDVAVRRVTFLGGDGNDQNSGGLRILPRTGHTGTLLVEQCAFIANNGGYAAALGIDTRAGTIRVRNSLFVENDTATNTTVGLTDTEGGSGGIYFTNNTVIDNTNSSTSPSTAGVYILGSALTQAFVANNNIWNNENFNLSLAGDGYKFLRNNNLQSMNGTADDSRNNISVEPIYAGGNLDYTLADGSPLIDAGIKPNSANPIPIPFEQDWAIGALDVFSRVRTQGVRVDIGAYESDFDTSEDTLFTNGFD